MPTNAQTKLIRSLHQKKFRKEYSLFVAEGSTNVLDLLKSQMELQWLFALTEWAEKFANKLTAYNVQTVSGKEMEKMTLLKNPSEVLAVFKLPDLTAFDPATVNDYILALDNIKDPGNLGTIIRTADWFGIKTIICTRETVDAYNPKVVQATMGSLARVNVHYLDLKAVLGEVPAETDVFGACLKGEEVSSVEKKGKGIILIGSEAHGISDDYLSLLTHKITIPSYAKSKNGAESLNAAVATSILCYEFRRS
jgi:TrmH family RNA methyltransferase